MTLRILSVVVLATLTGTAATLWALHALSAPVSLASKALRRYLDNGDIPDLPVGYPDLAGRLMADVQYAVERLDAALRPLGELATTDHLTSTLNRRAGEERLAQDVARAQRGGGTLTLAALDLDQSKPLNDRHGHHAGMPVSSTSPECWPATCARGIGSPGGEATSSWWAWGRGRRKSRRWSGS